MARVLGVEVKQHITTSISADVVDTDFIPIANAMVNDHLVGKGISTIILAKIELFLAAHFVALMEELGGLTRDSYGDSAQSMSDAYRDGGLNLTRYGQQALVLDTTGTLRTVYAPKQKAEFRVI